MTVLAEFSAPAVHGYGKGRLLGVPTINLAMDDAPAQLREGVYACRASLDGGPYLSATMHIGPRPVFAAEASCEVHILDRDDIEHPASVAVQVVERLRDIADFPSEKELVEQILRDNEQARGILGIP